MRPLIGGEGPDKKRLNQQRGELTFWFKTGSEEATSSCKVSMGWETLELTVLLLWSRRSVWSGLVWSGHAEVRRRRRRRRRKEAKAWTARESLRASHENNNKYIYT